MNNIQVGDLVYVYRWPCCGVNVGEVFIVAGMQRVPANVTLSCARCGATLGGDVHVYGKQTGPRPDNRSGAMLPYIKKIPPLGDLKGDYDRVPLRQPVTILLERA